MLLLVNNFLKNALQRVKTSSAHRLFVICATTLDSCHMKKVLVFSSRDMHNFFMYIITNQTKEQSKANASHLVAILWLIFPFPLIEPNIFEKSEKQVKD